MSDSHKITEFVTLKQVLRNNQYTTALSRTYPRETSKKYYVVMQIECANNFGNTKGAILNTSGIPEGHQKQETSSEAHSSSQASFASTCIKRLQHNLNYTVHIKFKRSQKNIADQWKDSQHFHGIIIRHNMWFEHS